MNQKATRCGSAALALLAFAAVSALAQSTPSSTPPSWQFSQPRDQLTGNSTPTYVLEGRYVLGGPGGTSHPLIVAHCANGKFLQAYLATGVVVGVAENENGGIARSLKGNAQGEVDYRYSGQHKVYTDFWEKSTNDMSLFFDHFDLADLLVGKSTSSFSMPHPGQPKNLIKRITFRVMDALGNPVEMVFDMPPDEAIVTRACGLESGKWRKKIQ